MLVSSLLMGASFISLYGLTSIWQLYTALALVGFFWGGLQSITGAALIVRWFEGRKGLALSVFQTGFSVGQLILIPLTTLIILESGWRAAFLGLGVMNLALAPLIVALVRDRPADRPEAPRDPDPRATPDPPSRHVEATRTLTYALRTRSFWLLALSFFICGFTTVSISTHFPSYASSLGYDPRVAALALGLMGGLNVVGTLVMGGVSDRVGRKNPLALTYLVRAFSLLIPLFPQETTTFYVFPAIFGFSYFATAPLTSALCNDFYGKRSLGTIYGAALFLHQVGAALGTYLIGYLVITTGAYAPVFTVMIGSLLVASGMSYAIRESKSKVL